MRFPWYVAPADESAMTALVATELAQWRASVAHHKGLPTVNAKLNYRRHLEQSFDMLKTAWAKVNEPMVAMAA